MKKEFTYASGFAGIGGMTMGLAPLGGHCVAAWEFDPTEKSRQYAQDAHKLLHPNVPIFGDITKANTTDIPELDVFCFTPPCQAFSIAGNKGGFDDTRGTLTFDALRIAKDKQPKVLFMENVKGLLSHDKGNSIATIVHAINEIGYAVDFEILNSKFYGVAQNRERLYLVAVRKDLVNPSNWNVSKLKGTLKKVKLRLQEEGAITFNFSWPERNKCVPKLVDFLDKVVDKKYYLSEDKVKTLVLQLPLGNNDGDDTGSIVELGKIRPHRSSSLANTIHSSEGILSTIDTMSGGDRQPKVAIEVRPCLTPFRVEKRQQGRRFKEDGDESFTITTVDRHGVAIGEYPNYEIRKLTPRECLRLQAVPENMIDSLVSSFSDSRCYKFAGNGLTTTVISAIGEKILEYL